MIGLSNGNLGYHYLKHDRWLTENVQKTSNESKNVWLYQKNWKENMGWNCVRFEWIGRNEPNELSKVWAKSSVGGGRLSMLEMQGASELILSVEISFERRRLRWRVSLFEWSQVVWRVTRATLVNLALLCCHCRVEISWPGELCWFHSTWIADHKTRNHLSILHFFFFLISFFFCWLRLIYWRDWWWTNENSASSDGMRNSANCWGRKSCCFHWLLLVNEWRRCVVASRLARPPQQP